MVFIVISIFIIIVIVDISLTNNELKKNGIIINVKIVGINTSAKVTSHYEYTFLYNGKDYRQEAPAEIAMNNLLIGKTFPAIFSPVTGRSELLLTPNNFDEYNLIFPDSLQWLQQYRNP